VSDRAPHAPTTADMVATSCGTAVAAVCAVGLFQIERRLGGVWSVAAILAAGLACARLARTFARLATVVPSGACLLAYLARGFGRRAGLALAAPYLLLTLFLVGAEAAIVGLVMARLTPVAAPVGALAFLIGTWLVCRAGIQVGYRAQAWSTWALIGGLGALSLMPLATAGARGELIGRLFSPPPALADLVAGTGQALFLFMGFELITAQVEITSARVIGRALGVSVAVLAAFYALLSLGFSCLPAAPGALTAGFVPQLALAEEVGGPPALLVIGVLSGLASFSSFNGALLALSRFTSALAAQGALPRSLARLDAGSLVPRRAMSVLLVVGIAATVLVMAGDLLGASIQAAAVTAALVYAAVLLARERRPFAEPGRRTIAALAGGALALALIALGAAVLVEAGPARAGGLALLVAAYATAAAASVRVGRPRRPSVTTLATATSAHGD
jgi:basic amino acid/polyamine antiporter, APA family